MTNRRRRARLCAVVALAAVVCPALLEATAGSERYEGKRLADALRALQSTGMRIVFSSEIVTPDMRVATEPRGNNPRELLDSMLKPHGLVAEDGPGGIVQVVRAKPAQKPPPRRRPAATSAAADVAAARPTYSERVMVHATGLAGSDRGVGAAMTLNRREIQRTDSVLAGDPVRAAHALPRVAAANDFRSEFSVRGSPYRHLAIVTDGVATPWLQHSAYGRSDAGSIAMLGSDVIEQATLQAGAYPQRYGDRLGAQLALTLREGSRTESRFRASAGGTSASLLAEGPLGGAERGSWLVGVRQSYLDWPVRRRHVSDPTVFGFSDLQSKLVYDVHPGQQLTVSVLGGRSGIDGPDTPAPLANGRNRAGAMRVAWRSTFGDAVLTQQTHAIAHEFLHKRPSGQDAVRGGDTEFSYRADMIREMFGGLFEAGGQAQRTRSALRVARPIASGDTFGEPPFERNDEFRGSAWTQAAYANLSWRPYARFTITSGVRVARSTLAARPAVGRWILGEWRLGSDWTMNGSAGVAHQLPELHHMFGVADPAPLRPERATHVEVGLERRLPSSVRWQATLYNRRERDVLRARDAEWPPAAWPTIDASVLNGYDNVLTGLSRGIELLIHRQRSRGLSGWAAYSYGISRHTDVARQETFWSDFDQRHALNLFGSYALPDRASVSVTFRSSSNVPIAGYLAARDGRLYAGALRNTVRLPRYARLDVRAERGFRIKGHQLTMFAEVLNVFNRANVGLARGFVRPDSGEAVGFTEPLFPRLPSAGLRIDF